jgi:hypothetical protein
MFYLILFAARNYMNPEIGLPVVAILLVVLLITRRAFRNARRDDRRLRRALRNAPASAMMSSRTQIRALDQAYTMMGPTTIREVEERLPTIDEHGNRMTLIRTRTLETVLGAIGPAEIERNRRHTLPGYGHVWPLSDTEFEVFHGGAKLRLDLDALQPTRPGNG